MSASLAPAPARLRVDKWLWAARFFKTRSLASTAVSRHQVRIGGQKIKPSRAVQVGDIVRIDKPPFVHEVEVLALSEQRRSASEAALLFAETAASIDGRQRLAERLRLDRLASRGLAGAGRPNRNQRRQIIRFQNVSDVPDDSETSAGDAPEHPVDPTR